MKICPCCTSHLLRQIRRGEIYWFCPDCRQAMPTLGESMRTNPSRDGACLLKPP